VATRFLAANLRGLGVAALASVPSGLACSDTAPARPQVLVFVDTDAHVADELLTRNDVSPDATVDTLRIDVLDATNETNLLIVSDPTSWPVSFGVARGATASVTLRFRLFRALFASSGSENGVATLDPPAEVTIDRVASISFPDSGVTTVGIFLASDCLGTAPSFLSPQTTCVDQDHLAAAPSDGVQPIGASAPATRVGTWPAAVDVPCTATVPTDRVCVPGGFDIMGEATVVGLVGLDASFDPVPYRPVILSPFVLDKYEFTVGRLRKLIASGSYKGALPRPPGPPVPTDPIGQFCTWLGAADPANDDYPVNCLDQASVLEACRASGGTLPTEAQWDHEARGRGRRWFYPWGNADPTCCAACEGRSPFGAQCKALGPEPSGSHPKRKGECDGLGDVSIDGALDMGGSVTEAMLDDFEPYDAPCWTTAPILRDPECRSAGLQGRAARGGNWELGPGVLALPLRYPYGVNAEFGFRCAYPAGGP